jgi:hypothetical protein
LRIESNQQQQSRYTTSPQSHFCAFDSPRINGIQRTIFVIYSKFHRRPPAAIALHLTIEQQQETKKAIQGGADLLSATHLHCPKGWGLMKIHKGMRMLSTMVLMGALAAPLALAQEHDRDDHKDRDDRAKNQRIYDRDHKDYHNWSQDEDRNYRQWYTESHRDKEYREYNRLNHRDQTAYWNWRHKHGDGDHDRDDHRDKDHDRDHR